MSAQAAAKYRAKNKALIRERRKKYYARERATAARRKSTPEGWAKAAIPRIRYRALRAGYQFAIDWNDIIPPEYCPVLGIKLELAGKGGCMNPRSPSVDRFDNRFGYTPQNVRVISNRANILKKDASVEELRALVVYMDGEGVS